MYYHLAGLGGDDGESYDFVDQGPTLEQAGLTPADVSGASQATRLFTSDFSNLDTTSQYVIDPSGVPVLSPGVNSNVQSLVASLPSAEAALLTQELSAAPIDPAYNAATASAAASRSSYSSGGSGGSIPLSSSKGASSSSGTQSLLNSLLGLGAAGVVASKQGTATSANLASTPPSTLSTTTLLMLAAAGIVVFMLATRK